MITKHVVTLGVKLPVMGIPYSSFTCELSVEGDNYEEVKQEAMRRIESQINDFVDTLPKGLGRDA